ncbi:MAG: hypothetical protein WB511_03955, partial [Nitrososphaeraceae archaeon]
TSMISFLGMTMSPSESAVVENTGAESGGVGSDSSANTDGGDSQTMNQDSGSADMTDTGDMGTDMGFDGFDAGGFDF